MGFSIHYTANGRRVINSSANTLALFLSSNDFVDSNPQLNDVVLLSDTVGYQLQQLPATTVDFWTLLTAENVSDVFKSFGQFRGELTAGSTYLVREIVQYTDPSGYVSIGFVNTQSFVATTYADALSNNQVVNLIPSTIFETPVTVCVSKAADAATSEANAAVSAGSAQSAKTLAEAWAENGEDIPVVASPNNRYSALHWAAKAAAAYAAYVSDAASDFATIVNNVRTSFLTSPIQTAEVGNEQITQAKLAPLNAKQVLGNLAGVPSQVTAVSVLKASDGDSDNDNSLATWQRILNKIQAVDIAYVNLVSGTHNLTQTSTTNTFTYNINAFTGPGLINANIRALHVRFAYSTKAFVTFYYTDPFNVERTFYVGFVAFSSDANGPAHNVIHRIPINKNQTSISLRCSSTAGTFEIVGAEQISN